MKNNQKCIRISDETLAYINTFPGNGFNQKLENMVAFVSKNEERKRKSIEGLEKQERELMEKLGYLCRVEGSLSVIKRYIDDAKRFVSKAPLEGQIRIG